MANNSPFCCTTHQIPASVKNSHLLTSLFQALGSVLQRQSQQPRVSSASHPPPSSGSSLQTASSIYFSTQSQPPPTAPDTKLFPSYPPNLALPSTILELEIMKDANRYTRHFSHLYFAEVKGQNWYEQQMYPEERFKEVPWERVEERWRKGVEYREEKRTIGDGYVGGRATEWVKRDDVGELGRDRVAWNCTVHGYRYWARVIRWDDAGEEGGGNEGKNDEKCIGLEIKLLQRE